MIRIPINGNCAGDYLLKVEERRPPAMISGPLQLNATEANAAETKSGYKVLPTYDIIDTDTCTSVVFVGTGANVNFVHLQPSPQIIEIVLGFMILQECLPLGGNLSG